MEKSGKQSRRLSDIVVLSIMLLGVVLIVLNTAANLTNLLD